MDTHLTAQPIEGLLPVREAREPPRALIASLAPGGAERIVLEWLAAESARGRRAELAILHPRRTALPVPARVGVRLRGRETPAAFLDALTRDWGGACAPISTHLVTDECLARLWVSGLRTVPVVHNMRGGWRNDPSAWEPRHVPHAVACAGAVRREMLAAGCRVPVHVISHRPYLGPGATDERMRRATRAELAVGDSTLLVAAIGAFKAQKDHARAIEVLARLCGVRDAVLVILGGILERSALGELDRVLDAARRLGVEGRLRLPGFVTDIEPWLAACDAVLNVSRFEGLSIATQEALAAGLPVVASDVGGQREIGHGALELVPADASPAQFAERLARHPVRDVLVARPFARAPRAWSLTLDTLFVTANLNAGGAQRSLVNLAAGMAGRHRFAIAVCGDTTHRAFPDDLALKGIEVFRPARDADDFAVAESILAHASARAARAVCFWNTAPRVKLLAARFAPDALRIVDVSPGGYSFEEMERERAFGAAVGYTVEAYYERLDCLVMKHATDLHPRCRHLRVIPNGVGARTALSRRPAHPRFLVSGRIAPSKRLETIIDAFAGFCAGYSGSELHVVGQAEPRHASYAAGLITRSSGLAVHFRGARPQLDHLDEAFTAAIILGTHQGCPNAVLEAMAAGIPVIANASGGTGELVRDGHTGWLLPENASVEQLAAALSACVHDPSRAESLARAAREHVRREHSIERMAERYRECLGSGA